MHDRQGLRGPGTVVLALLALPLLWDAGGWDMALAEHMGGPAGFALKGNWWLTHVLHDGARQLAWALGLLLCLGVAWPVGPLRRLPFARRLQLALSGLLATGMVALVKSGSHTSCPWDLAAFGGVARYQSHWLGWQHSDGGAGRCFPAGHASAGFAFVAGWFALRRDLPRLAAAWLVLAIAAGLVLGLAQQLRGAHFMSHTLWTAWICAAVGWGVDLAFAHARKNLQGAAA
ncbi:phosphatase PAP2 family protein [Pseudorhodoferax soli]|uniref:phosphatase PAP2 family protein n=1 Tax=Pseudorhodoferax soli TaxID=545864 RepID=UPI000DF3E492|nr:phosphatase PAP2 family protein [Pseudorhodoferax soli]